MNELVAIFLVGIGLSMDAFSLSLIYGTIIGKRKNKVILAILVGIYHFIMPLLGHMIGDEIIFHLKLSINIVVFISFFLIALDMLISCIKEKEEKFVDSLIGYIVFGFTVSIDSFVTGVGINAISTNHLLVSLLFFIVSGIFTFVGLELGDRLNRKVGKYSVIGGSIILMLLSFYYLFYL